jgi:hypothetical protein
VFAYLRVGFLSSSPGVSFLAFRGLVLRLFHHLRRLFPMAFGRSRFLEVPPVVVEVVVLCALGAEVVPSPSLL